MVWPGRTRSIALWSAIGGGVAALGPLVSGCLLEYFWWGSVFLVTLPLVAVALVHGGPVRARAMSTRRAMPVDNLGGILSVVLVGALILAINFAPVPNKRRARTRAGGRRGRAGIAFILRQRRAPKPLYDLDVARRRIFWVAACAGIIVFGSLMGAAFVSQQYLQNVLGYSTLEAGAAILPGGRLHGARRAALGQAGGTDGARFTLLLGYVFLLLAFIFHAHPVGGGQLVLADRDRVRVHRDRGGPGGHAGVALADGFRPGTPRGDGVGDRRPAARPGWRIMTSIFGALLTAGYASAMGAAIAASGQGAVTESTQSQLQLSYASAADLAASNPQYSSEILAAAKSSFLDGDQWAYSAGTVAVVLGAVLVFFMFPKQDDEERLRAEYHAADAEALVA